MAQGSSAYNIISSTVGIKDGPNLDAFSRLRVSNPESLFSTQCQYNADPIQLETSASGTGISGSFSTSTRMVALSATAGTGTSYIQSYQYTPYQPGKSQLILITGLLSQSVANANVDVHYGDANNGIIFRQSGSNGLYMVRRTSTSGAAVEEAIPQESWSLDRMNGSGSSGHLIDPSKVFIYVIDLQFLGMGRVRTGFDIGGDITYVHEFNHSNLITTPYMQTATLPVGMTLTANSTAATKTCYFKCAAVLSEGGFADAIAFPFSTVEATETAGNGTRTHLLSIRPKPTFNGITNRESLVLTSINLMVTGVNPVYWELVVGMSGSASTWADIDSIDSAYEYTSVRGAFGSIGANGHIIASGYSSGTPAGGNPTGVAPITIDKILSQRYPITLDKNGNTRLGGTLSLLVSGIGGTSVCRASYNFKEFR